MNGLSRFLKHEQRGQALVLITLILLVLLMFAGLAVDAGQLYSARRTMQEAADAAAYAGAVVIYQKGGDPSPQLPGVCGLTVTLTNTDQYYAAVADATKNGFTNGVNGVTLTVNTPPRTPGRSSSTRRVATRRRSFPACAGSRSHSRTPTSTSPRSRTQRRTASPTV